MWPIKSNIRLAGMRLAVGIVDLQVWLWSHHSSADSLDNCPSSAEFHWGEYCQIMSAECVWSAKFSTGAWRLSSKNSRENDVDTEDAIYSLRRMS